jgi:peptidoglycan/xylan/chitin deacetylase (PgdA/CDA1 family)
MPEADYGLKVISVMAMGIGNARALFERARNRFLPGSLILLYHRVGEPELDPQLLSVSRPNFDEHLQVLRNFCTVPLASLLASGQTNRSRIALTFDDGYADNLWNAKPLLEKYAVPATVFVSVGHVLSQRAFWWDEALQLVLRCSRLPETLSVTVGGGRRQWFMGISDAQQGAHPWDPEWNILAAFDPSPRHSAYREMCAALRELPPDHQETVLNELRSAMLVSSDRECEACTAEELRRLREPGLIDIGAHTCAHPMLSRLPVGEQQKEISRSKELLEEILGNQIEAFSYPYGTRSDYSQESVDCVRRSGFRLACSNYEGHVRASTDHYQLPRYVVRNWDGETFTRQLKRWFHTSRDAANIGSQQVARPGRRPQSVAT